MSHEELTTRLMGPWRFDQQDLEANRNGQLSAPQLKSVREMRQRMESFTSANPRNILIGFLLVLLVGGGSVLILMSQSTNLPISPVSLVLIGLVLVLILIFLVFWGRRTSKKVEVAKDVAIELLSVHGTAHYVSGGSSSHGGLWYGVEVGSLRFASVGGAAKQKAFVEGESYRIYYTEVVYYGNDKLRELRSAEAI
jgi:hypothetical protein